MIPLIGDDVVKFIWGGFSVREPTLTRFYSLHFVLPFIITVIVILHLLLLHKEGSRNSVGTNRNMDKLSFHPYFTVKDMLFILFVVMVGTRVSLFEPYMLGDPVNNVPANAIQTPVHIQPEWYFLPSYAILRSLPRKTAGVLALALSVTIFYILPIYGFKFSTKFIRYRYIIFWLTIFTFLFLMKIGALPAEEPYVMCRKVATFVYFSRIIILNI